MEKIISERSANRLSKEIKKRIETTMIGALASIEDHLGPLWGIDSEDPTREQLIIKGIYEELRSEILDKGNSQIRAIEAELANYDVVWNKYHINIPIKKG